METTANIRRMWIKNAVTWNTKNPPSHSRSKTNPRTRNIVRLFLTFDVCRTSGLRSDRLACWPNGDVTTASGVPAAGEATLSPLAGPYFEKLGAQTLPNVAFGGELTSLPATRIHLCVVASMKWPREPSMTTQIRAKQLYARLAIPECLTRARAILLDGAVS